MAEITKNESVSVTYKNDVITIKGQSFSIVGKLPSAELMKIYWGNTGKGSAQVTMDVPDEPKPSDNGKKTPQYKTLDAFIEAQAKSGMNEEQIMEEIMKRLND